jgi:hypothetical protein
MSLWLIESRQERRQLLLINVCSRMDGGGKAQLKKKTKKDSNGGSNRQI